MDRRIAGVAGGLGEYLGVDATALRVGFVIASVLFLGGIGGPILYVIAWILIPDEAKDTAVAKTSFSGRPWHDWDRSARSWALVLGALALAATWSFGFWPWWHWGALPVWLVVMALILLALARHRETSSAGGPPTWSRPTEARPPEARPTEGGAPGPAAGPYTAPTGTATDVTAGPASQNGNGGAAEAAGSVDGVGVVGGAGGVDRAGVVSGAGVAGVAGGPVTPAAPGAVAAPAAAAAGGRPATEGPLATDGTVAPVGATATAPGVTGTSGGGAGQPGAATTSALTGATAQGAVAPVKPSNPTELSEADLAAARTAAAKWAADQLALAGVPATPNGGSAANGYASGGPPASSGTGRHLRRALRVLVALIAALVLLTVLTVVGVTLGSGSSLSGGVGDNTYAPVNASAVRSHYRLGAGNLDVNLSQVEFPASGKTVDVTLGLGNLSVEVPRDAVVTVQAHSGIGQVEVFGQTGSDVQATYNGVKGRAAAAPHLNLDAHVGMGHLQVTHT